MKHGTWWMLSALACALATSCLGQPPASIRAGEDGQPLPALVEAPPGIAWGAGRDVQAGVRTRLWAPSQHAGRYVVDVYVRNRSNRTVTVDCPSSSAFSTPSDLTDYSTLVQTHLLYCTPIVRDRKGRVIPMRYQPGTDHLRYTLEPGKVAHVAIWMLRTMPPAARTAATADYKQVVFVEPGKYGVACEVSARWTPGTSRMTTLRSGEATVEVTRSDLDRR